MSITGMQAWLWICVAYLGVAYYITILLLDAALPLKSIMKNVPMWEFWRESI